MMPTIKCTGCHEIFKFESNPPFVIIHDDGWVKIDQFCSLVCKDGAEVREALRPQIYTEVSYARSRDGRSRCWPSKS